MIDFMISLAMYFGRFLYSCSIPFINLTECDSVSAIIILAVLLPSLIMQQLFKHTLYIVELLF